MTLPKSVLTKEQKQKIRMPWIEGTGELEIVLRYDDECGNGHNTFAMTGSLRAEGIGGCIHDLIIRARPDLEKFVKWHLCSSDGPLHYVSNSMYHASERDHWGKLKGQEKDFKTEIYFNDVPIPHEKYSEKFIGFLKETDWKKLKIVEFPHINRAGDDYKFNPKYSFEGFGSEWHHGPFDFKGEAENFLFALSKCKTEFKTRCVGWGEGKTPDLEAARAAAIWPDAALSDFTKEKLEARLPALMQEFKNDMEGLGFKY
jgi:hypothetical protein